MVPGRFNLKQIEGVEVILDYGHNVAALQGLGEAVTALDKRRTIMVIGLPGDRRDQDLGQSILTTTQYADEYVLYDLEDRRGRAPLEVPKLLRGNLPAEVPCELAPDQPHAIQRAWQRVRPGDRLIVIADEVEPALAALENLVRNQARSDDGSCIAPMLISGPCFLGQVKQRSLQWTQPAGLIRR